MAEILNDDPWNLFHRLFCYADDRCIHKYGNGRSRQRRDNRTYRMVCILSSHRDTGIQALRKGNLTNSNCPSALCEGGFLWEGYGEERKNGIVHSSNLFVDLVFRMHCIV